MVPRPEPAWPGSRTVVAYRFSGRSYIRVTRIFGKLGIRSRKDLITRISAPQPRLKENLALAFHPDVQLTAR
jgi:hypothetical protein